MGQVERHGYEAERRSIAATLTACDLKPTDTMLEQAEVLIEALAIFQERDRTRGEAWMEFGTEDKAHHLKSKAARINAGMRRVIEGEDLSAVDLIDEAHDIINYAAFFIRQARAEQREEASRNGQG